ncbi:MAG: hypothetical protein RLN82_01590, partial [Pseudomonadales bacterium]
MSVRAPASCFEDPGTDITWEGGSYVELDAATTPSGGRDYSYLRLSDGTTYESGINVLRVSADASSAVTVSFTIDESTSTAIEGVHYTVSGTSATIESGSWVESLPITVLADNIEPGEVWTLDITLTDASIPLGEKVSATATLSIQCPSELAGIVDYEMLSNNFGGPNVSGSFEWIELPSNGVYTWETYTFGSYQTQYGCCEQGRTSVLNITDVCRNLSISSADGYG